jgi:glycosyltransferase involved in cell wall biosynthesis
MPELSDAPAEKTQHCEFRIGWCGRMIGWKHPDHILRAVALLPEEYRKRCRVSLVGDGECKSSLVALATELKLSDIVEFKPYMTVAEVAEWMAGLDVYLFPSDIEEGWGVVLAEAMDRCCVPIACVEAGATLDLIDDGENGFVFEKNEIGRIAKKQ